MKAIETFYKGYRFRSRLEARWAVFFDACGVKWEYEPEGFDLGDGNYYLPDFLLHDVRVWRDYFYTLDNLWVEVKGVLTLQDAKKIYKFANFPLSEDIVPPENSIYVVTGFPEKDGWACQSYMSDASETFSDWNFAVPYNLCTVDGDWFTGWIGIDDAGKLSIFGNGYTKHEDYKKTEQAFDLARQARFEHGEHGQ